MLLSFRVVNHRSLRDLQHLNLAPIYEADRPVGTNWPAVPVVAVYGANASGKSNLIDALTYLRDMVLGSDRMAEPGLGVARIPFRLDPQFTHAPSSYEVHAMIDGTHYSYGFAVDDDGVVEEWLYRYPKKRRQVVFAREGRSFRYGTTAGADLREAEGITAPNALFMSVAARAGKSELLPFYQWLRGIQLPTAPTPSHVSTRLFRRLLGSWLTLAAQDETLHRAVLGLLRAADLGIEDFGTAQDGDATAKESPRIWFRMCGAKEDASTLSLADQSSGTRLYLERMFEVLDVLGSGSVTVVDELESNLHPNLAGHIVRMFQDPTTNPHGAQLIFTSHDTSLLGSNAETLKRDQIWFAVKDCASGASRIFPLTDFKPRDTENTERRYRGGSYRAVPFVDEEAMFAAVAESARRTGSADA
ncbi:ATP-binding protein [Actinospica durhamensis]|uniref:ATP-binding protein n=1 Tax=Actinospica durhamensis TaxID=1508375 RepID=A0A941EMB2_9ACTN|nr:ATP-binding protein [Actinospica durhamensis]MBR7834317.1 ATP-binding protein [Actinospica durhamensis]